MAEQRQPFRFRLPWLAASQPQPAPAPAPAPAAPRPRAPAPAPAPAAPRPRAPAPAQALPQQPTPTPAAPRPRTPAPAPAPAPAPTQRPPFRPAGVAQPARAEPPPSPSRAAPQTQAPPPAPTRPAPQTQHASPRSPASRVSPPPHEAPKAAPPSATKPTPPPPTQALKFPLRRNETTTENSQPQKEPMQTETKPTPPQKPRPIEIRTLAPPPEKVVEPLAQEKLPEASRELAKEASSPKPETKQQPIRVGEPTEMPKAMRSDVSKQKPMVPDEVVIEKKEVQGHEKVTRATHKHATKEKKEDSLKFAQKHDKPYSIITLSGENTGATMHLRSSDSPSKKERSVHIHRGYKSNPYESVTEAATDGDKGSFRGRKSEDLKLAPEEEVATKNIYVNNNIQGINNSLVFNSSLNQRNPGVHLVLSRMNPEEPVVKTSKERQTVEARKAEVATTPAERLAYAPTVRRRCLRGLFLESSDSDPENPEKPRHHGCRVGCSQKDRDENNDVL